MLADGPLGDVDGGSCPDRCSHRRLSSQFTFSSANGAYSWCVPSKAKEQKMIWQTLEPSCLG